MIFNQFSRPKRYVNCLIVEKQVDFVENRAVFCFGLVLLLEPFGFLAGSGTKR